MRTRAGWLALGLVLGAGSVVHAYFLDKGRNFDVRLRAYSQLGILTEDSSRDGDEPQYELGDLAQHRNFYNPEFDAKLADYTRWMGRVPGLSLIAPDDFRFRFAWWGFYDGLYDYLDPRWNKNRQNLKARVSQSDDPRNESLAFNDQNKNPRHIYGSRNRINELYFDYTKGRFFFRVGRQAISWGEADTIALLDVSNPFDLSLAAPGVFQDVDESRIPLWTLRSTIKLVDNWRWLSSLFADLYLVPGPIDTTVPNDPIVGGVTPFGPDQGDPQAQIDAAGQGGGLHLSLVQHLPENTWANSRWGARLTGVLFRDYTVQGWFFRTFNQAPAPLLVSPGALELSSLKKVRATQVDDRGFRTPVCLDIDATTGFGHTPAGRPCKRATPIVNLFERRLESVVGLAATWYNELLNGIIRTEAEYFLDELAFIPDRNLNARSQIPKLLVEAIGGKVVRTSIPKADFLRFLVGYDRFFFVRPLNPSTSFTLSTAFNGSININEVRGDADYRNPNPKPGMPQQAIGPVPGIKVCKNFKKLPPSLQQLCVLTPNENFEDLYPFEGFLQTALQTDYMHGRLSPRLVVITDIGGIFMVSPTVTYRFTDSILATMTYIAVMTTGRESGLGTFRDHDMLQLRLTYQLN